MSDLCRAGMHLGHPVRARSLLHLYSDLTGQQALHTHYIIYFMISLRRYETLSLQSSQCMVAFKE